MTQGNILCITLSLRNSKILKVEFMTTSVTLATHITEIRLLKAQGSTIYAAERAWEEHWHCAQAMPIHYALNLSWGEP